MSPRNYFSITSLLLLLLSLNWIGERPLTTLTVASYNALFLNLDAETTLEVLYATQADIIGLQEVNGILLEQLAEKTGFFYYQLPANEANLGAQDVGILSRFPIEEPLQYGVVLRLPGDRLLAVFNVHLAPFPYIPHLIRDGKLSNAESVLASSAFRLQQIEGALQEMKQLARRGLPLLLTGDFNEPSHLDWSKQAAAAGLHFGMDIPFPVSRMLRKAGYRDVWRAIWPDEVAYPGHTWRVEPQQEAVSDRIDFIYFKGSVLQAESAFLIGEKTGVANVVLPDFPSDHRAVVATFSWQDAPGT